VLYGDTAQGFAALRRALEVRPEYPFNATALAWAYAHTGRRTEALEMIEQVEPEGQMLKELAIVYAELGAMDRAFDYLDRAYAEDPGSLTYINADPTADALRSDPRFPEFLQRLGLEQ